MNGSRYAALLIAPLLLLACAHKQGGACQYQAFEDRVEIVALKQDSVITTGTFIEIFHIKDFAAVPAIGDRYHVQGKKLLRGSCTPIVELQVTKYGAAKPAP